MAAILVKRETIAVRDLKEAVGRVRRHQDASPVARRCLEQLAAIEEAAELYLALANLVALTAKMPARTLRPAIRMVKSLRLTSGAGAKEAA